MNSLIEQAAVDAVRSASALCRKLQQDLKPDETLDKSDRSPVTIADYCAQALISRALEEVAPDIPMIAEEDFDERPQQEVQAILAAITAQCNAGTQTEWKHAITRCTKSTEGHSRYWVLDPIDGTKGFLRNDQFAISLALVEDGTIVFGVLGCPNFEGGSLYVAKKGEGVTRQATQDGNATKISQGQPVAWSQARFCESVESAHSSHDWSSQVSGHLGITSDSFRIDSQCKYAAVASGNASVYLRLPTKKGYQEKVWDHAAGLLVVTEAGGTVTDIHGKPLDFSVGHTLANNEGVVASRGVDHQIVIEAVQATSPLASD